MGHQYYQFPFNSESFLSRCKEEDVEGFRFLYPDDEIDCSFIDLELIPRPQELPFSSPKDEFSSSDSEKDTMVKSDSSGSDEERDEKRTQLSNGNLLTIDPPV